MSTVALHAQTGRIRPGIIPGTERWVAVLSGRGFDLRARFDAIRREPLRARREALLAELRQSATADHQEFGQVVTAVGGRLAGSFWTISACVVEIPPNAVRGLRSHPRVVRLVPDEEREHGSVCAVVAPSVRGPVPPSSQPSHNGTDEWNHNVVGPNGAHGILGHKGNGGAGGQRAYVAVFDSGVDLDQSGHLVAPGPDDHHYAFRTGTQQATSRIITNVVVGEVDCNWPGDQTFPAVDPWCPPPLFQAVKYPSARHGTGVAGIILGQADPWGAAGGGGGSLPPYSPAGHAEEARLLSFAITNRALGNSSTAPWPTSEATIIAAVQALQTHMLASGDPCHVLNISYHMWPDPDDPTQLALDHLEREFDVLVVTLAGNEGDATIESPGFTNGITVGNAHKFRLETGRYPHRLSSRGPLVGDPERYFPDVCASGSHAGTYISLEPDPGTGLEITHIVMPLIDYQVAACNRYQGFNFNELNRGDYNAQGSSMAAPQVAGAAALYRAERASASAQETRAALLLATIDPFLQKTSGTDFQHTYVGRNVHGVGYVRDDLMARYAKRTGQGQTLGQTVTLTAQAPNAMVSYTGLTADAHYAVAIAWPRQFPPDETAYNPWSNIDLEVRRTTGEVIARSDSTRNLHERLVFKAGGTTAVEVHVLGTSLVLDPIPVFVAARPIGLVGPIESRRSIAGYVERIEQETTCTAAVQEQATRAVVPSTYSQAWGSMALSRTSPTLPRSDEAYTGVILASAAGTTTVSAVYDASVLGVPAGQTSYWVRALAFRTWRPFSGCDGTLTFAEIWMNRTFGPIVPMSVTTPGGARVALNVQVPMNSPAWHARNWNTWPIIVPLDQPFEVRANEHLQVWIKTAAAPCVVSVDAVGDGSPLYRMVSSVPGYRDPGDAPVLGMIEGSAATVRADLTVMGFPTIGRTLLFGLRQSGGSGPGQRLAAIAIGTSNPGALLGSCRLLTSGEILLPTIATHPMGHGFVPFPLPADPTQLHKRYFAQAVVFGGGPGDPVIYTNGVRFTIGGVLP